MPASGASTSRFSSWRSPSVQVSVRAGILRPLNRIGQELPKIPDQGSGVVGQLLGGHPDRGPAGDAQQPVAFAIALERLDGAVRAASVELDDDALLSSQ